MSNITVGSKVQVTKGNRNFGISKGARATVIEISPTGADLGYFCRVALRFWSNNQVFWVRHINRLSDATCNLNKGDPTQKITIRSV
jgi:hypothetical protein